MKFITAERIYTGNTSYLQDKALVLDNGAIHDIVDLDTLDQSIVQRIDGIIVPGFINAHCHLELSHMLGKLETGTGLLSFIGNVVKQRGATEEEIQDAIYNADKEMYENGIDAVGDISNVADTAKYKSESPIRYYTFVEIFDFMQAHMTQASIEQYGAPIKQFSLSNKNKSNFVPHAPYSVSQELLDYIAKNTDQNDTISIHNQETPPENELFLSGTGPFHDFYKSFDLSLDHFEAPHKSAIHYILDNFAAGRKMLFVHNTLSTKEDILDAINITKECYWASCPNANLYIENRLPDYRSFMETNAKVCIGTDSLTSNWQLDILEEMKTIQKYNSYVSFETLITWACKNGAEALGFEDLGKIKPGSKAGLVKISDYKIKSDGDVDIQSSSSTRINI